MGFTVGGVLAIMLDVKWRLGCCCSYSMGGGLNILLYSLSVLFAPTCLVLVWPMCSVCPACLIWGVFLACGIGLLIGTNLLFFSD